MLRRIRRIANLIALVAGGLDLETARRNVEAHMAHKDSRYYGIARW